MPQSSRHEPVNFDTREQARLMRNSTEITRRALTNSVEHGRLKLEVETFKVAASGGLQRGEDLAALQGYVERRIQADDRIQSEYSNPAHPYWRYKCATYGTDSFNKRLLCPKQFFLLFNESFSGCFCTKYKTHMLDAFNTPEEAAALVEQAHRIGHPYELVFIPEGQEGAVEKLQATGLVKNPKIVLWMDPRIKNPPVEERKDLFRGQMGVNAIGMDDMAALYYPPIKSNVGVDLAGSLTGLDMWTDLVRANNLVKIDYQERMYRPPYRLDIMKKIQS